MQNRGRRASEDNLDHIFAGNKKFGFSRFNTIEGRGKKKRMNVNVVGGKFGLSPRSPN